jgi:hypothetical protein
MEINNNNRKINSVERQSKWPKFVENERKYARQGCESS